MNKLCLWIRSIGRISATPFLAVAAMMFSVYLYHAGAINEFVFPAFLFLSFCLLMTFPLAIIWKFIPGETALDRYVKEFSQARNREELRKHGISVEEYMATLNGLDVDHKSAIYEKYGFPQTKGN